MSSDSSSDEARAGAYDSTVAERVYDLLSPLVATADVELLDVEWTGGTLRVVLDHEEGVTTDTLTRVNRLVSPILDQHDPVPGRYTLEVSSPGVERPLRRPEHYRRAVGESVIVKTVPHVSPRRVKGALLSISDGGVTIDVTEIDGVQLDETESTTIDLGDIRSARTVFEWGPTPKKGGPKHGKSGGSSRSRTKTESKQNRNEVGHE